MSTIFVSYSRESEHAAKGLVSDLEALGHSVWFDRELSGGQAWWDQILAGIRRCDAFVVLLDAHSLKSRACNLEFEYADSLGKPIVPVLAGEGISMALLPPALSRLQLIDYRKADRAAGFELARGLTALSPAPPLPEPLPPPPDVPLSYLGAVGRKINAAASLTYDEQSALVLDLTRALRDRESSADAGALLHELRKRRDLFAPIAEEIDGLLAPAVTTPARWSGPAASTVVPTTISVAEMPPLDPSVAGLRVYHVLDSPWLRALVGLVVGGLLAVVVMWLASALDDAVLLAVAIVGVAGALSGAITRNTREGLTITLLGAAMGLVLWWAFDSFGSTNKLIIRAVVFGSSLGALIGAIGGTVLARVQSTRSKRMPLV